MLRSAMVLLLLCACGSSPPNETPAQPSRAEPPGDEPTTESIGVATMEADGTLVLQLRAEDGAGTVGEGYFRYPPDHPQYRSTLEHIGADMRPGESRPVPPFPEDE
jgi:hypothetical protein